MNGTIQSDLELPDRKCGFKNEESNEKPTLRFELDLKTIKGDYAEFNYLELVASRTEGDDNTIFSPNLKICDGFNYDKVIGYDTADSFIDDSELFDEYVAPTSFGFHINYKNKKTNKSSKLLTVKKPKLDASSTVRKKHIKCGKKRHKVQLAFDEVKVKKLRSDDDDEVQIVDEIIRTPLTNNTNIKMSKHQKTTDEITSKVEDTCVELPPNLSEDLINCINLLKICITKVGKVGVLNERAKQLLIVIEENLLTSSLKTRSNIYLYLAYHLGLSAKTLKMKSKSLVIRKINSELDDAILKLAKEILSNSKNLCNTSSTSFSSLASETILKYGISSLKDNCASDHGYSKVSKKYFRKKDDNYPEKQIDEKHKDVFDDASSVFSESDAIQKIFLTATIKNLMLVIFRLKKKLYDAQRNKGKMFLEELVSYIQEDINVMWPPLQRDLQSLLDFANMFYVSECDVKKFHKLHKAKENLVEQKLSVHINGNTTVNNIKPKVVIKNIVDKSSDKNILKKSLPCEKNSCAVVKEATKKQKTVTTLNQNTISDIHITKIREIKPKPHVSQPKKTLTIIKDFQKYKESNLMPKQFVKIAPKENAKISQTLGNEFQKHISTHNALQNATKIKSKVLTSGKVISSKTVPNSYVKLGDSDKITLTKNYNQSFTSQSVIGNSSTINGQKFMKGTSKFDKPIRNSSFVKSCSFITKNAQTSNCEDKVLKTQKIRINENNPISKLPVVFVIDPQGICSFKV